MRTKRVDTRPNAKFRIKEHRKADKNTKISDLRVTRIKSSERKEREVGDTRKVLTSVEKRLRALRKKLSDILELKEKKEQGIALNAEQETKLNRMDELVEEIQSLVKKIEGGSPKNKSK